MAGRLVPGGDAAARGRECMFMEVTTTDDRDLSNIDARTFFPCAAGPTPDWRLLPFDNNLAQRNVAPVPGVVPSEDCSRGSGTGGSGCITRPTNRYGWSS